MVSPGYATRKAYYCQEKKIALHTCRTERQINSIVLFWHHGITKSLIHPQMAEGVKSLLDVGQPVLRSEPQLPYVYIETLCMTFNTFRFKW